MTRMATRKRHARFKYWRSLKNGQWYFRFVAPNGEPMHNSEGYVTKQKCKEAIQNIINYTSTALVEEVDVP